MSEPDGAERKSRSSPWWVVDGSAEEDVENLGVSPTLPEVQKEVERLPAAPEPVGAVGQQRADKSALTSCASDGDSTEGLRTVESRDDSRASAGQEVPAALPIARQVLADVLRVGSPVQEPFRQ